MIEQLYPSAERWELDTILQEEKLCYLYEKMGYKKTGQTQKIKAGMDIVFYAK
ncbi:MAG: GNAT family acetyltransferase [Clostridia bacterium]